MCARRLFAFLCWGFMGLLVLAGISMAAAVALGGLSPQAKAIRWEPDVIGLQRPPEAFYDGPYSMTSWATLALAAIVCGTLILLFLTALLFRTIRSREQRRSLTDQDGRLLEELWQGLQKMEDRVLNLETILLERGRARDYESRF